MTTIGRNILDNPDSALSMEWLVTNGIGGYASSTVAGANARWYHGLLVAALPPPLERQVMLAKVDEDLIVGADAFSLGMNEYQDGIIHPQGYRSLKSFRTELGIPTFEYQVGGATLIKQVWMERDANTVYVLYNLQEAPDGVCIRIRPFCAFRGYHGDGRPSRRTTHSVLRSESQVIVTSPEMPVRLRLAISPAGSFVLSEELYRNFLYREERARGFDYLEHLYTPGVFLSHLSPGDAVALVATCESELPDVDPQAAFEREMERRRGLVGGESDSFRRELLLAADQFVIKKPCGNSGTNCRSSILAGYHWFTEWGRDAMISLPGLLLPTGRHSEAREILLRYIERADHGMIPNRFADDGTVEYNTADATLWYFQALYMYIAASDDRGILRLLFPILADIIRCHMKGTRFGVRQDPSDGLLFVGRTGTQVTWMDACVDGCPVTPRIGKPVEINALWFNALCLMSSWARELGEPDGYAPAAEQCASSFRRRFWREEAGYLYDVIDGPVGDDPSLRPNQVVAVSLPHSTLDERQQKLVVDAVERALLTPYGLRTLSPDDPGYVGRYRGGPAERDCAYHQGTVWPWLLGPFADAHYRVYQDKERIADLLKPFHRHLAEAGIGSISELFDGDPPHTPGGCIAQAWSVAEILRISEGIQGSRGKGQRGQVVGVRSWDGKWQVA